MRDQFGWLAEQEGFKIAIEVGVQAGWFAKKFLETWPSGTEYWCIDLWAAQKHYADNANVGDAAQLALMRETQDRLSAWSNKVHYIRNYSSIAVNQFKDNSIDFIYLDARHDYTGVMEDLVMYYPKLREGGIIAGHDYYNADEVRAISNMDWSIDANGVKRADDKAVRGAVEDFTHKILRQAAVTYKEAQGASPSWYFRK
jgi:predicted O-methyltransferase YrrM